MKSIEIENPKEFKNSLEKIVALKLEMDEAYKKWMNDPENYEKMQERLYKFKEYNKEQIRHDKKFWKQGRVGRVFTEKDVSVKDMLRYGRDHLETAGYLFNKLPFLLNYFLNYREVHDDKNICLLLCTLDSAGYLAHLGIEQILKAYWLWKEEEFHDIHNISDIIKEINFPNFPSDLNAFYQTLIEKIDLLGKLRYPRENSGKPVAVGQKCWGKIIVLYDLIIKEMPADLYNIYENATLCKDTAERKGGRIIKGTLKEE